MILLGEVEEFFEQYLLQDSIFSNKAALQAQYIPNQIVHREEQQQQVARVLAPVLRLQKPSNLFIYGKTGTGKTLVIKQVLQDILKVATGRALPIKIVYVNCKLKHVADTEYRLLVQILRDFGKSLPTTGLPTEEVYRIFYAALDEQPLQLVLVLDEIDELIGKTGNSALYNLTRCNTALMKTRLTLVGICNNIMFTDGLDPRIKSSLSEEELIFPPYNALQLQSILQQRSSLAFRSNVMTQGVLEKCAAFAAREHGDARRALDLLRVAGELADRAMSSEVLIEHLDEAEKKLEKDHHLEAVANQPRQYHAVLYAVCKLLEQRSSIFTGEVYSRYQFICSSASMRPLTQRRVSDILGDLDILGLVHAPILSKGRYGRTRQITLPYGVEVQSKIRSMLDESLALQHAEH